MDPVTISLISAGVGGALKIGADLFDDTAHKQAGLLRDQAQLKLSTLEENMRRTEGQQTQVLSSTKARMAGTGFSGDSPTFTNYITTMADQFQMQNTKQEQMGRQSVDLMRRAADLQDRGPNFLGAAADLFGTGASMAGMFKPGGSTPNPGDIGVP